jgi:uncharacterized damage-inducible protein DinB
MKKIYRKGAVGALMDEYERAVLELKNVLRQVSFDEFVVIRDLQTADEDCRSIQTIVSHVVGSGYGYANGIRRKFAMPVAKPQKTVFEYPEAFESLDDLIEYTAQTLENHWEMSSSEMIATVIELNAEFTENFEQLLEHAIVHVLRHRRQIEKFLTV